MTRWLITLSLCGFVLAGDILARFTSIASSGQPSWLSGFRILGVPVGPLALILLVAGVTAFVMGRLPLIGRLGFHNRFNAALVLVLMTATTLGLLKGR